MKYKLTHRCDSDIVESKVFDSKQDAINMMIQKVKDIAMNCLQNDWIHEELPGDAQMVYKKLLETGHVAREGDLKIRCFDFEELEVSLVKEREDNEYE